MDSEPPVQPDALSALEAQLRALLAEPRIAAAFDKMRIRCDQKGDLTGSMLLLRSPHHGRELLPLKQLLGESLSLSARGELRIRFDSVPHKAAFISALYAALGVPRRNLVEESAAAKSALARILDRLQLQWPELVPVAEALAGSASWQRRICAEGEAPVQALLFEVAEIADFLRSNAAPIGVSELGARFCGDSKVLRGGERLTLLGDFLVLLDAGDERESALARCSVVDNPSAIKVTVFGPLLYRKGDREMSWIRELWELGESATLSWDNLQGSSDWRIDVPHRPLVICCENETPFCRMMREREGDVLIYTEGYANAAVKALYVGLPRQADYRHWGDSDHDGLRIAAELAALRPLELWRCGLRTVQTNRDLLIPLCTRNRRRAECWLKRFPNYRYREELQFALAHGWLEQERFPANPS
jgi:hypothetical protein